jgi:hypothetical protein
MKLRRLGEAYSLLIYGRAVSNIDKNLRGTAERQQRGNGVAALLPNGENTSSNYQEITDARQNGIIGVILSEIAGLQRSSGASRV